MIEKYDEVPLNYKIDFTTSSDNTEVVNEIIQDIARIKKTFINSVCQTIDWDKYEAETKVRNKQ